MSEPRSTPLRADIQALRAIAVLAVLVYHLWPAILPGGFAGVDVFFVLSGFLITANLVREAEATGRIRIWTFWSRRARRLLPAALLVLVASAAGVLLWVPENLWPQFLRESVAATLYVQNWVLAGDAVDYHGADNAPSPAQHFWTLSVEEQFYVAVPLLLVVLLLLARPLRARRAVLLAGIGTITVASFAYSVWLTETSPPTAYFVTTARAWEFGVGALLVFAPRPRSVGTARLAVVAGLAGIASATVLLSGGVPFPGATAAWPVLAAAAAIWGGDAVGRRWEAVARFAPLQLIGGISYSMYLWHWPLIVILPFALGHPLTDADRAGIAVLTVGLAVLSTRYVEDPIRHSTRLLGGNRSPVAIGAWAAAGMAMVVSISGCGLLVAELNRLESQLATAAIEEEASDCLGTMAVVNGDRCDGVLEPDVLVPDPAQAATDTWNRPECWAGVDVAVLNVCTVGPDEEDATLRLAAIGDSHSNVFLAAWERLAEEHGWRIDIAGHNGCYWTDAVQRKPVPAMAEACEGWKDNLEAFLAEQDPYDAILVTHARFGHPPIVAPGEDRYVVEAEGLRDAWARQTARGTRIVAVRDNPQLASDVVACVVRHRDDPTRHCSRPAGEALGTRDALVDAVELSDDARLVDLTDILCPDAVCVPVVGNVVVYQDEDHLTATFVRSLAPVLGERIRQALR